MDFYMLDPGGLALQRCYFSDFNVVYPQVHDIRALIEFEPHTPSIQACTLVLDLGHYCRISSIYYERFYKLTNTGLQDSLLFFNYFT